MELFIGNLPADTTVSELVQLFESYGDVAHFRIIEKIQHDGTSLRFGHGKLEPEEAAMQAISELDGTELRGHRLKVRRYAYRDTSEDRRAHKMRRMPWGRQRRRSSGERRKEGRYRPAPDSWR